MAIDPQMIATWLRRLGTMDILVFDDVRANPGATIPGVLIVALASFLSGLGGWLWWVLKDFPAASDVFVDSVVIGSVIALVLWGLAWLGVVYVILTQVFRERVFLEQLLRVMGLGMAPLALSFFIFIPGISLAVGLASLALTFTLTTIAVQSVTTADTGKVLLANFAGFGLWALVLSLLGTGESHFTPGVFLFNAAVEDWSAVLPTIRDAGLLRPAE